MNFRFLSQQADAAEYTLGLRCIGNASECCFVYFEGFEFRGLAEKTEEISVGDGSDVFLNSSNGSLQVAMKIGRLFQRFERRTDFGSIDGIKRRS